MSQKGLIIFPRTNLQKSACKLQETLLDKKTQLKILLFFLLLLLLLFFSSNNLLHAEGKLFGILSLTDLFTLKRLQKFH